ncbi:hypothetical protein H0H87_000485, partial [Tephrocybe sp. NHM501043]
SPTHLKKEINAVLSLQGQIEAIDYAIHSLQAKLSKVDVPKELLKLLSNLQQMQEEFKKQSEALYSLLNIHDSFPKLVGVDLEFVQMPSYSERSQDEHLQMGYQKFPRVR